MGRRQVVRHLVLVQAFGGSNPSAPEKNTSNFSSEVFFVAREDENQMGSSANELRAKA